MRLGSQEIFSQPFSLCTHETHENSRTFDTNHTIPPESGLTSALEYKGTETRKEPVACAA